MSKSLAIVAVGAVCVGAVGAAITLPALVLGSSETPRVGLPLAASGTRTVVHAAPLSATPASPQATPAPRLVPSHASAPGVRRLAPPVTRPSAATSVRPSGPKYRPVSPVPTPATPQPATPQPTTPQPAEPNQPLLTLSENSKKAKHAKRKKHVKHSKREHPEHAKGHNEHPNGGPKAKQDQGSKPKHDEGQKPKDDEGQKPKHEQGPKPNGDGQGGAKPPKDDGGKPPKNDGGKGADGKAPKR
jgi:translation initiation factor IF-2